MQDGRLRALGLTTARPSLLVPGVPPIAAAGGGTPDYDIVGWNGLMVPAGTPRPIAGRLVAEVEQGLATSASRRLFETLGVEVEARGPDGFMALPREPWGTFGALINRLGIRAEQARRAGGRARGPSKPVVDGRGRATRPSTRAAPGCATGAARHARRTT